jgi:stage II sporulation protein D
MQRRRDKKMMRFKILFLLFLIAFDGVCSAQIRVRLFSSQSPESAIFSVTEGRYEINSFDGRNLQVNSGESVVISRYNGKLAVKIRNARGLVCDSLIFEGKTGNDAFSLRVNGKSPIRQNYSGDLKCLPDLETVILINICDFEKYIAGVVKAEGGSGKNIEYFKSQAVIARTYMYKYFDKHISDKYNLCDNTHCQAFNGMSADTILNRAALDTRGVVILDKDSMLIISAFHSNCGGETSSSEDVWLTSQPYLKKVVDPYCLSSRNAEWERRLSVVDWFSYLKESGYTGTSDNPAVFSFLQSSRIVDYRIGSFTVPLRKIRTDLNLRSTFFSVYAKGDSVILKGKGYGHGVGLCQEGAMVMASKGFTYSQIIDFYYSGVLISDIKKALILPANPPYRGL